MTIVVLTDKHCAQCRVLYSILYHTWLQKPRHLRPDALFSPIVTRTHSSVMEIDYNLHKSNSTYFSDVDIACIRLLLHLCAGSMRKLSDNTHTRIILDPRSQKPIKRRMSIVVGSVQCTFKREITCFQDFEMWSHILTWDRKWLYVATHFVAPEATASASSSVDAELSQSWQETESRKRRFQGPCIYATAVSKYVFKLGRLSVHPALVLEHAGLLPVRAGGWTSEKVEQTGVKLTNVEVSSGAEPTWQWVESQRRAGMGIAAQLPGAGELRNSIDCGMTDGPCKLCSLVTGSVTKTP